MGVGIGVVRAARRGQLFVSYNPLGGVAQALTAPDSAPPGANDWSSKQTSAHPEPVALMPGTSPTWRTTSTRFRRCRTPRLLRLRAQLRRTKYDRVVTPYRFAFLTGGNVTNITMQNQCPLDLTDPVGIAFDPIALTDMLNALNPAHPDPRALPARTPDGKLTAVRHLG